MAFVNSSGFIVTVPVMLTADMQINGMLVRGHPWQPLPLTGMKGYRVARPDDPVLVFVQEFPISISLDSRRIPTPDLERIHIDKFCTDHQLATNARPYSELRAGPNSPDFLGVAGSASVRIDCT